MTIEADLTTWDHWWEFNKDRFLGLRDEQGRGLVQTGSDDFYLGSTRRRDARDSLRPTESQLVGTILPALKKVIDSTDQRDINSSCMVAMAKVGMDHPDFTLLDVFAARLRKPDQEIRETAALAIGIAAIGDAASMDLLVGLVLDDRVGRAASGGSVDDRTRSFAAYSLGLTAHRASDIATKIRAFEALKELVADDRVSSRNLKVAAIHGIGLLNLGTRSYAEVKLCAAALKCLEDYYVRALGPGDQIIQAHCPTVISKLIARDHPKADHYKQLFARDLQRNVRAGRDSNALAQSCALALGQLVMPNDELATGASPDAGFSDQLLETCRGHKDATTRHFAIVALAQIGGRRNRDALLREFDATNNQQKPWCALALGVYAFVDRARHGSAGFVPDRLVSDTLLDALKQAKDPVLVGALAIGLGLNRSAIAADAMRARMLDNVAQEQMAGYLCIGLALMEDARSTDDIRRVVMQATRRPELLVQAAVALGKLGDQHAAADLCDLLTAGEPNLTKLAAIAKALGYIGDRRSVAPLVQLLSDERLGHLPRAFAAAAIGGVADRAPLPWNSAIGANINYEATVETLTNQSTGILDIL
ncbi:MAG TPA: hypothetical protein VFZ65_19145 [Planctomycetota bacterium]|nr:hypothetical protein [Planctomycetota bacterium]